jgi:hypothetical protein
VIIAALAGSPCAAQWWWPPTNGLTVSPECLDVTTPVSLTVSGLWPDACRPNFSSSQVNGNVVELTTIRDPPPGGCLTVITNWELTEIVGPLAAGHYTVYVKHMVAGQIVHPRVEIGTFDVVAACPGTCYANCDGSTTQPVLNVNDFVCFQSRFASADPYADCDHSSTLNVNDFVCFQQQFAAGCP